MVLLGFYNMYTVTQDNFEYPQNQQLIYEYHNGFVRLGNIIKDDDWGLSSAIATRCSNFRMLTIRIRKGASLTMRDGPRRLLMAPSWPPSFWCRRCRLSGGQE